MKTEREHNNTIVGRKDVLRGGGAGYSCILMMPGGIIAVGLTSGDSTGIGARSGGADGTAPMVLTRQRQCHPGPAGISWRGKAPWGWRTSIKSVIKGDEWHQGAAVSL